MASGSNGKRNTSRSLGAKRSSSSGKKPASGSGNKKTLKRELSTWEKFRASRFFRPALTVAVITVLVLLDLLLSWNNYNRFFVLLGIELIIAAIVWVIALGFNLGADLEASGDNGDGA